MFGFNWIDAAIAVLLIAAVWRGLRTNFWSQFFTIGGFFLGLLVSSWLLTLFAKPHLSQTDFLILKTNLSLIVGIFCAIVGNSLGYRVHFFFMNGKNQKSEKSLSVFFSVLSVLIASWLIAATFGRLPFEGLSNSANDARIVQFMNGTLPSQPRFFSLLDRYVNPNDLPRVNRASNKSKSNPANISTIQIPKTALNSVVRITGFGCGGIVSGSGFIISPGLVMTNAHVVAGVKRPIVKHGDDSFEAVPVYFNAQQDSAMLRVNNLTAPALELTTEPIPNGTAIAILGYPEGNLSVEYGNLDERITIYGSNIYNVGEFGRDVYELNAHVEQGISGSPVISADGRVAGMVFAKSEETKDYGYALISQSLSLSVLQVLASSMRVGTGICVK
jgi:S1-C subfamily serine protease